MVSEVIRFLALRCLAILCPRTALVKLIMLKAFVRWMLKTGRIEREPFPMATCLNPDADPRSSSQSKQQQFPSTADG